MSYEPHLTEEVLALRILRASRACQSALRAIEQGANTEQLSEYIAEVLAILLGGDDDKADTEADAEARHRDAETTPPLPRSAGEGRPGE